MMHELTMQAILLILLRKCDLKIAGSNIVMKVLVQGY